MKFCHLILGLSLLLLAASPALATGQQQLVAGAGPSTVVAQLFFELLKKKPAAAKYDFLVPAESSKHAGGIKNSDQYLFGRIGRPLNELEKHANKVELFLAKVPFVFVVGSMVDVKELSLAQVKNIFAGRIRNWQEVGGPDAEITVVGREATEAMFSALKKSYPEFSASRFTLTLAKDHQVIEYLKSPAGAYAIAFGARPNFSLPSILNVSNFSTGVNIGLVYDLKNTENPLVSAARDFARSTEWRGGLALLGLSPADQ